MAVADIMEMFEREPDKEFTLIEVSKEIGHSISTTSKNLKKLVRREAYYIRLVYVKKYRFKGFIRMYGRKQNGK